MAKLTFKKAFTDLQKTIAKMNTKGFNDFAFQFVIEGDGAGTFYAACKDEKLAVEPYNYEDNTATFKATAATFAKLVAGEVAPDAAIKDGSLVVEGDPGCADIFNTIAGKKPAKKTAKTAAKPAAKKTAAKPAAKKTAAKPAAKKAAAKPAAKAAKPAAKPAAKKAAAKPAVKKEAPKAEAKPAEVKPVETKAAEVKPAANKKATK